MSQRIKSEDKSAKRRVLHRGSTQKGERIDIRLSIGAKALLQRAAAERHKTLAEFLVDSGLSAAAETHTISKGVSPMKKIASFTVRMPIEKKDRLRRLAEQNGMSVNHLFDELATIVLAENDAYHRFLVRSKKGDARVGLALLSKMDRIESSKRSGGLPGKGGR